MSANEPNARPIPLLAIVLVALAVHGPLLLMQLPSGSFDANFHIFLASHYAHHWFNPWNEKWFAGFSQTTYPPLTHQWIALVATVAGLKMAYMLVQLVGVLLLPVGVFRFARIWVEERADGVVGTRHAYQLRELAFELRLLLAQHLDLPLDQRDGRAAAGVRQLQSRQHRLVALEELGMALQVAGDAFFFAVRRGKTASLSCRHIALDLDVTLE